MHRRSRHINPAQAGAQIALDARFIAGQADNTTLQTWPSRAVASITGTQPTPGSRPTYRNPSINGQPALVFNGSSDCYNMSSGGLSVTKNVNSVAAWSVCQCSAIGDVIQYPMFISSGTGTGANRFSIRAADTSIQRATASVRRRDDDTNVVTTTAGSTANPVVFRISSDFINNVASSSVNGGTATTVGFSSGGGAPSSNTDSLVANIGGRSTTNDRLNGKVAMLVVMTPMPSTSLMKRIRHHIAYSYKITSQ